MASTADNDSLDAGAVRKVLRLLDTLRQSQAGGVIYHQIERMLEELVSSNHGVQRAYAAIASTLLDAFAGHLHAGSPLNIQVKMLRTRLQPPLSVSDLQALQQYVDVYHDQIIHLQELDQAVFAQAFRPLLQAFGIETEVSDTVGIDAARTAHVATRSSTLDASMLGLAAVPPPVSKLYPTEEHIPVVEDLPAYSPEQSGETRAWVRPTTERHPLDSLGGQPTITRESERAAVADADIGDAEVHRVTAYRSQLDARRRDIQELQSGLAQQVLDTIAQNQEFGVLLEVVLSELRQIGEVSDLENLRWTLIGEIEKLMSGHHELADKLDSTHHYLQVIESDSRQLTDELTRVRLLSLTDELTGLPNRRAFLRRLEDEVARVQRYGFPLSLALIDLDKFKDVNDKFGHAGGDEVLRVYSKNILSTFRHHDLVARYGGEEFAVLLPNTEREGALRALNKVKQRCAETRWQSNGNVVSVPTFSAGLALYKPGETSTAFLERVDKALYRAKRLGRNRVEIDMTYQTDGGPPPSNQKGAEPT
jgi:diguanylate cyclase (GGDEF)-like protein